MLTHLWLSGAYSINPVTVELVAQIGIHQKFKDLDKVIRVKILDNVVEKHVIFSDNLSLPTIGIFEESIP